MSKTNALRIARPSPSLARAERFWVGGLKLEVLYRTGADAEGGDLTPSSPQRPVEVDGGADQRQVRERLREIAELFAGRPHLLGVQAEMVGVGEHLLKREPRRVQAAGPGQCLDVPERADRERALLAGESVRRGLGAIAVDEAI